MLRVPITELLSEADCYQYLLALLHPARLHCPHGHALPPAQAPHKQESGAVVSYRCRNCHAVFNLFTATLFSGTHYSCRILVLFLRGGLQGLPTRLLADELSCDYGTLLAWRHRLQATALAARPAKTLVDRAIETDEMFRNAGEKGELHTERSDPPRRRANKHEGRGIMNNDRTQVIGVVGREMGLILLTVVADVQQTTIEPLIEDATRPGSTVYSDEAAFLCIDRAEWVGASDGKPR